MKPMSLILALALLGWAPSLSGQTQTSEPEPFLPVHLVATVNVPPLLMGTGDFRYLMNPAVRAEVGVGLGFTPWVETSLLHLSGVKCVELQGSCGDPATSIGLTWGMNVRVPITSIVSMEPGRSMIAYAGAGFGHDLAGDGDTPSRRYQMGFDFLPRPGAGLRLELAIVSGSFTAFVPSLGLRFAVR